ncbi:MAG TPA: phenol degradation protein meta, partial [Casimicrobiaceae bacterium]
MFMRCAARALAIALVFGCAGAYADEGGTPFWTSGQFASLAAVPPSPGWSVSVTPSYYSGNAGPNLM